MFSRFGMIIDAIQSKEKKQINFSMKLQQFVSVEKQYKFDISYYSILSKDRRKIKQTT